MYRWLLCLILVGSLTATAGTLPEQEVEPRADAARDWLRYTDSLDFSNCWQSASSLLREHVDENSWKAAVARARQPLGNLHYRDLASAHFTNSLPGVPDGEYQVLEFETGFSNKPLAQESVTLAREADGQWRVAAYAIR